MRSGYRKVTLILRLKTLSVDSVLTALSTRGLLSKYLRQKNVKPNRAVLIDESGDHILVRQWEYNAPVWGLRYSTSQEEDSDAGRP